MTTNKITPRFSKALGYAVDWHGTQKRKGVDTPYIAHLMAVSALVMEYGGTEDQAIAGLLHDALEDAPTADVSEARHATIRVEFGTAVIEMVEGCTDGRPGTMGEKAPWRDRKESYLLAMGGKPDETLLVSGCDKLHNLGCTVRDLRRDGPATLGRFNAGADGLSWYYGEIGRVLSVRGIAVATDYIRLMDEFRRLV